MERVILGETEITELAAQYDENAKRVLSNRVILARILKGTAEEFADSDYEGIKKVYSIWICMNSPSYIGNAISEYSITKRDIVPGIPDVAEDYDKLSVVVICLNRKVIDKEINELIGILNTLFDEDMSAAAKKQVLNKEYDMVVGRDVEEVMGHMCNLGEGIYEEAKEEGRLLNRIEIIHNNLLKNISLEALAELVGVDVAMVRWIAEMVAENADVTDEELVKCFYKNNTQ